MKKQAIIICGPTASGKSHFGHTIAKMYDGEIVNIDSRQIHDGIPIITASPSMHYKDELPYHLYNFLPIDQEFSVIKYLHIASETIRTIASANKLPIIIGGTGLYINSLLYGYNEIPDISPEIRQYTRKLRATIGEVEFSNRLQQLDALAASKIAVGDTHRSLRAYEVFKQTGRSIYSFQGVAKQLPLPEFQFKIFYLLPQRTLLQHMCNNRLEQIFTDGAIEEVESISSTTYKISSSASKAVGIREIRAYLNGEITKEQALILAQAKTRQYAKRQITWFNTQLKDKITLHYTSIGEFDQLIRNLRTT